MHPRREGGRLAAAADPLILSHLGQVASWVGLHHDHDGGDLDDGDDGGDGAAGRQPSPLILNETAAATYNPCSVKNANTNKEKQIQAVDTNAFFEVPVENN